jgi:hypothetical protein
MSAVLDSVLDAERRTECARNDRALAAELQAMADAVAARRAVQPRTSKAPAARVIAPTEAEYRAALARHDWTFERSDDHGAWCAGRDSLAAIRRMGAIVDPSGAIFDEYERGGA